MNRHRIKEYAIDLACFTTGGVLMAAATVVFNAPNNIAPGGVTGLAILANYLTGWSISVVYFCMNIPLLILAYIFLGKSFTAKTLITVFIVSAMTELMGSILPEYHGEVILAALYGGVLGGAGLGIVFMRSATTGGSDIVMRLIQIKRPDFSSGRLLLVLDFVVISIAMIVYRNFESALYAIISIFAASRMIDGLLYGLDMGKMLMIFTKHYAELAEAIHTQLGRGCTLLSAKGAYTGQDRPVLICAVRKSQYYELKRLAHDIDPTAFVVALDASEVIGEGFKTPHSN